MSVKDDKSRVMVTITKEEREKLNKIAIEENRSLSNLLQVVIKNYLDAKK